MTLKRDLEYTQQFGEKMQDENRKLQADVDNLTRLMEMKEKTLALAKKEAAGLQEDNERLNRMYQLVSKEAFGLKAPPKPTSSIGSDKPKFQPVDDMPVYTPANMSKGFAGTGLSY